MMITTCNRPYREPLERLRAAGLRPTRQRLALAKLLFIDCHRHVTAEMLHNEAMDRAISVSLATVYNTLHQFTDAGLLREIVVDSQRCYFDTNTTDHYHFFNVRTGELTDILETDLILAQLPPPPAGSKINRIEIIVRIED